MDIKNAGDKLEQADGLLTTLKTLLKKHWGILLICVLGYGAWQFIGLVGEEMDKPEDNKELYIVETYKELDPNGDTLTIQVWSDGIETVAE